MTLDSDFERALQMEAISELENLRNMTKHNTKLIIDLDNLLYQARGEYLNRYCPLIRMIGDKG